MVHRGQPYRVADGFILTIDPEDHFQAMMAVGLFDPSVAQVLRRYSRPGSTVLEAGGHLGYFTLRLGRWVGPRGAVHSSEPDPRIHSRLREHVAANALDWVTVNPSGLLDAPVEAEISLPDVLGWASIVPGAWGATQTARVQMTSIDAYVAERGIDPRQISLVKLDVEGAELDALHGAANTLAAGDPAVLVEYLPERIRLRGQEPEDLLSFMREHGYAPWVPRPRRRGFDLQAGTQTVHGDDVLFLKAQR